MKWPRDSIKWYCGGGYIIIIICNVCYTILLGKNIHVYSYTIPNQWHMPKRIDCWWVWSLSWFNFPIDKHPSRFAAVQVSISAVHHSLPRWPGKMSSLYCVLFVIYTILICSCYGVPIRPFDHKQPQCFLLGALCGMLSPFPSLRKRLRDEGQLPHSAFE